MEVFVDKGVELLCTIWHISYCNFKKQHIEMFNVASNYVTEIHKNFDKFKNDEVVKRFSALDFKFNVISWGYALNDEYKINFETNSEMKKFLGLLPDFVKKIDFEAFFKENQPFIVKL